MILQTDMISPFVLHPKPFHQIQCLAISTFRMMHKCDMSGVCCI